MQLARLLGPAAVLLALASVASAQTVLYTARVMVPMAEVRSGPSNDPKLYPTNRLPQGTLVEVVKEVDKDWLAIVPPAGSFSWINARFVERTRQASWAVSLDDAPLLYGSDVYPDKPTVESTRLPRGYLLVSNFAMRTDKDGKWLPVESPRKELRYIRQDAVAKLSAGTSAAPVSPPAGTVNPPPAPGPYVPQHEAAAPQPSPAAAPPPGANSDWLAALQEEQAGHIDSAIRLYSELGKRVQNTDHDLAMQCFNKVEWLRVHHPTSVPVGYQPGRPTEARYSGTTTRLYPVAAGNMPPTATLASPCYCPPANQSTCRGRLRRSGRSVDCRYTYVLESSQGLPLMYVTAQPGVNLEGYVGRNVEVTGPAVWHGTLRCNYMTANRVVQLP